MKFDVFFGTLKVWQKVRHKGYKFANDTEFNIHLMLEFNPGIEPEELVTGKLVHVKHPRKSTFVT